MNKIALKNLKEKIYKYYKVTNSKQLKAVNPLAKKYDLRYKKNWQLLEENITKIIPFTTKIVKQGKAAETINSSLQSISEDLANFKKRIKSDFTEKRNKSQEIRQSLKYI